MTVLLRALGLQAAYAVLQAMSPAVARVASVALLLTVNAVPLVALLNGDWGAGDVLITYWLENVAVGFWALVKILTVETTVPVNLKVNRAPVQLAAGAARPIMAAFFTVHYGLFTAGHGFFTFVLAGRTEVTGSVRGFALMFLALLISHGLSTGIYWFARGERHETTLSSAMGQPYGRILVLHFAVLGSAWLLVGHDGPRSSGGGSIPDVAAVWPAAATLGPGLVLIALKVVIDVLTHLQTHREVAAPAPARIPA